MLSFVSDDVIRIRNTDVLSTLEVPSGWKVYLMM